MKLKLFIYLLSNHGDMDVDAIQGDSEETGATGNRFADALRQQSQADDGLERQYELFRKQLDLLEQQTGLLERLNKTMERTATSLEEELISLFKEPLLQKQKVMDLLGISDSTYRRYVVEGKLNPMCFDKIDWYFKWDLRKALENSRKKGKI